MQYRSPLVLGALLGLMFTLTLNAGSLARLLDHRLTVTDLGVEIGSADEVYYFALLRDVRDGHLSLGNASLYEHRNASSVAGYALLPQGVLARLTNFDLTRIVLFGDVFFPFAICALAFLLLRRFLTSDVLSALFTLGFMMWWGGGWLRSMNPQVTMTLFLLSLLVFVSDPNGTNIYPRGAMLFLLLLVQPIYAAYMLTVEGLDSLMLWMRSRSLRDVIRQRWPLAAYVVAAGLLQMGLQRGADAMTLLETYQRRGLIPSHLPTAPLTQLLLLALLGCTVWLLRCKRAADASARLLPILLIAGVIVLNQSLLHGRDAVFGLYYRYPLSFVLMLTMVWILDHVLPRRMLALLAVIAVVGISVQMFSVLSLMTLRSRLRGDAFLDSDVPAVMQVLSEYPQPQIVLAPLEISNLVPVLTQHYALFTQYAHFEYASDRELAERYLLLQSFFPLLPEHTVEGHPLVFGIYAGNVYARTKILCRLHLTQSGCEQQLSDFIPDQSVRRFVEAGAIDPLPLLAKYGVTVVVTDHPLPPFMVSRCTQSALVGHTTIFDCRFTTETLSGTGS